MIGVRVVRRAAMRPGRVGLFLGLVLLITAHLAGAVHASSFTGPPVTVEAATAAQPPAGAGHGHEPAPAHRHSAGGHIDHAADRPRATADEALAECDQSDPAAAASGSAGFAVMPTGWGRPVDIAACATGGPGTLALHCVWRL
ncbi:hypothetical protein AB0I54_12545 [Streptomyces sp. NPDC050625]|uniref:hypothetical protein n=1 Tax=Streptomyces sp. NPDC050625 TaxID=3154629 RepID=UPI00341EBB2D